MASSNASPFGYSGSGSSSTTTALDVAEDVISKCQRWCNRIVVGKGRNAVPYEVCLPGLDDLDDSPESSCEYQLEDDTDSACDFFRSQMLSDRRKALRFQVRTLKAYGIEELTGSNSETVKTAIETAKQEFLRLNSADLKSLMSELGCQHNADNSAVKNTILELLDSAEEDILAWNFDSREEEDLSIDLGTMSIALEDQSVRTRPLKLTKDKAIVECCPVFNKHVFVSPPPPPSTSSASGPSFALPPLPHFEFYSPTVIKKEKQILDSTVIRMD